MTDRSETERPAGEVDPVAEGREGGPEGPGLEDRLRRLEEILAKLESQDLELGVALELFQEGVEHIRRSEALLAQAELQVEELLGEGQSSETRPFPGGADPASPE